VFLLKDLASRDQLEDLIIDAMITLKWILRKENGRMMAELILIRLDRIVGMLWK